MGRRKSRRVNDEEHQLPPQALHPLINAAPQNAEPQNNAVIYYPQSIFVKSNTSSHIPIAVYQHICDISGTEHDELTNLPIWMMRIEEKRKQKLTIKLIDDLRLSKEPVCTFTTIDKHEVAVANQRVFGNAPDAEYSKSKFLVRHCNGTKSASFTITHETTVAWRDAMKHVRSFIDPAVDDRPRYCGRIVVEYQLVSKTQRDGFVFDESANGFVMDFFDVFLVYWRTTKEAKANAKAKREKLHATATTSQSAEREQSSNENTLYDAEHQSDDDDVIHETQLKRTNRRGRNNVMNIKSESNEKPIRGTKKRSRANAQLDDDTNKQHMQRRSRRKAADSDSDATITDTDSEATITDTDSEATLDEYDESSEDATSRDVLDHDTKINHRQSQSCSRITSSSSVTSDATLDESANDDMSKEKLRQIAVIAREVHRYVPQPVVVVTEPSEQSDTQQSINQSSADDHNLDDSLPHYMSQSNNRASSESDDQTESTKTSSQSDSQNESTDTSSVSTMEYDLQSFSDLALPDPAIDPPANQATNAEDNDIGTELLASLLLFIRSTWNRPTNQATDQGVGIAVTNLPDLCLCFVSP